MLSALCYRPSVSPSVCLSVCLSVTRVDQSQTVEVRIMRCSPYSSPHRSNFCGISFIQKFQRVPPERGHQTSVRWGKQAMFYHCASISPKRYEIHVRPKLLTNRKLHMRVRLAPCTMTLDYLELENNLHVFSTFRRQYLADSSYR